MPDLPSTLALTSIATDADITSAPHRNNYSAIQTAVNALKDALSGGTTGQVLTATDSDTVAYATPASTIKYRKTTAKTVNTTVAETDLLNGEITVAANAIGATGRLRLHVRGDWKQNSGGAADVPRLKLKLGGTTLIDIGPAGANVAANGALRYPWRVDADIFNLGAANAQWVDFQVNWNMGSAGTAGSASAATGEGAISTIQVTNGPAYGWVLGTVGNSGAVDTTAGCALVLSVINASANANYEVVLKSALVVIE